MAETVIWSIAAITGYLLGSIPFGLVIIRLAGLGDIRGIGSGNIGATNVLRTGRKDLALATFLLDSGKAGLATLAFALLFPAHNPPIALFAGAMALIGHCFPVWLQFKGGKGIATYAGLLFAATWKVALFAAPCWLLVALIFRQSSLAALVTALLVPIVAWGLGYTPTEVILLFALTAVVYWRHIPNIRRLMNGTEPKIGKKSRSTEDTAV